MKAKIICIVICFSAIIGCKKDNLAKIIPPIDNSIFEVRVGDNYFSSIESSGYIFLSRADGSLIDSRSISNNDTVIFNGVNADLNKFTVTIAAHRHNHLPKLNGIQLFSYINVPSGSIWRLDKTIDNSVPPTTTVNLLIKNTGTITYAPFEVWGSNSMGFIMDNSDGDLSLKLRTKTATSALAIYQSILDNKVRYVYRDNLVVGESLTMEHNANMIIDTPTIIDIGQKEFDGLSILGYPIGGSNHPFGLSRLTHVTGVTEHFIPNWIFERYLIIAHGKLSGNNSFITKIIAPTIESSFATPDYDYEVVQNDSGFIVTPTSDFDYVTACFKNQSNYATWCITGDPKTNISLKFPTIPSEVLNDYTELLENLIFSDALGYKSNPPISFEEYLNSQFPLDSTFVTEPTIGRSDIVKKKP